MPTVTIASVGPQVEWDSPNVAIASNGVQVEWADVTDSTVGVASIALMVEFVPTTGNQYIQGDVFITRPGLQSSAIMTTAGSKKVIS